MITSPTYELQTLDHTPAMAEAWAQSLSDVATEHPEAFGTYSGMTNEKLEEARRYFFTAKHNNRRVY